MEHPPYIKAGDRIAIVAPAKKITPEKVTPAITQLEAWGLDVVTGTHLYDQHGHFAGSDADRLADFQQALDDDAVKAILCARGGYGAVRIIDQLDFSRFRKNPKWIVGYSDITVFHGHLHSAVHTATIHGTMPLNFPADGSENVATETLQQALFGTLKGYDFPAQAHNREGNGSGVVVGGNLSILHSVLGSASDIDTRGKLLFIEEIDEYLYHIDRMFRALDRAGKLADLAGLVIGGFTDVHDNPDPFGQSLEEIIRTITAPYDYPIAFGFPAGHQDDNRALYFGKHATLSLGPGGSQLQY